MQNDHKEINSKAYYVEFEIELAYHSEHGPTLYMYIHVLHYGLRLHCFRKELLRPNTNSSPNPFYLSWQ